MKLSLLRKKPNIISLPWIALILLGGFVFSPTGFCHAARQVTLAWDANQESSLMGYRVFCRQSGDVYHYSLPAWEGAATTCTLAGIDEYTDYAFVVRAYDASGNESADSAEVWLYGETAQPAVPTVVSPENNTTDLFLTPVLQTAAFSSPDGTDRHLQTQWMVFRVSDGLCVLDLTSTTALTELDVPPLVLAEGTVYSWRVRYYGAKGTLSEWSTENQFVTGWSGLDSDGDGIPDDQEVDADVDLDGNQVPDVDQDDLRCVNVPDDAGQMGLYLPSGSGVLAVTDMEATDLDSIGSADRLPFDLPQGLISFRLELTQAGAIAHVRVLFSQPAAEAARWVKYDIVNGWQDYSAHAVFAGDRLSVDIEIQDGGFGDADGVENGIIIDPSGYGLATTAAVDSNDEASSISGGTTSSSGGGGGGGCFIATLWP